jgi:hypothetical protein
MAKLEDLRPKRPTKGILADSLVTGCGRPMVRVRAVLELTYKTATGREVNE